MAKAKAKVPEINLEQVLEEVAKEKGVEKSSLIETIEAAILKAAQNTFGPNRELEARYNPQKGHVELYQFMTVVEEVDDPEREIAMDDLVRLNLQQEFQAELGEELGFQIFWHPKTRRRPRSRTRSSATCSASSRRARVRPHRRADRQAGAHPARPRRRARPHLQRVQGQEGRAHPRHRPALRAGNNIIVDLGRTEAHPAVRASRRRARPTAPATASSPTSRTSTARRAARRSSCRAPTAAGREALRGRGSRDLRGHRAHRGVAREPGAARKIAVTSRDADVDPVGACVGMKGSRVQAVVQELRGEKIDIVPYDRDPARYVIATPSSRPRSQGHRRRGRTGAWSSSSPTRSSRSPSAARARTCASRRSSPAGSSTSSASRSSSRWRKRRSRRSSRSTSSTRSRARRAHQGARRDHHGNHPRRADPCDRDARRAADRA
jgi:transcription termination/antitermination protein NusA